MQYFSIKNIDSREYVAQLEQHIYFDPEEIYNSYKRFQEVPDSSSLEYQK
jgi:hypothetical protein